jgi:hypothetical protein
MLVSGRPGLQVPQRGIRGAGAWTPGDSAGLAGTAGTGRRPRPRDPEAHLAGADLPYSDSRTRRANWPIPNPANPPEAKICWLPASLRSPVRPSPLLRVCFVTARTPPWYSKPSLFRTLSTLSLLAHCTLPLWTPAHHDSAALHPARTPGPAGPACERPVALK